MNPHEEQEGCESLMIGGISLVKAGVFLAPHCHNRPFADSVRGVTADWGGSVLGALLVNHHPAPQRRYHSRVWMGTRQVSPRRSSVLNNSPRTALLHVKTIKRADR